MNLFSSVASFFAGIGLMIATVFGLAPALPPAASDTGTTTPSTKTAAPTQSQGAGHAGLTENSKGKVFSRADLLALAGDDFKNGSVPLGDSKYVTSGPKKGYIYLCNVHKDNPGSMVNGPWITGDTWNFLKKITVDGAVTWAQAGFSNDIVGANRVLSGNDLPVHYTTGVFPVAATDDAHQYDPNPNTITAQSLSVKLPANPVYSEVPYCMGGEVGVMTNGVALFNGFDAGLRDAAAHELQDSNDGHPQGSGEYHYHSIPAFNHDASVGMVIGFAYDGFPITGPVVASGKYLTTNDLDECHGLISDVTLDGKTVTTYHYVMTYDFPYSASCFRGKPVTTGPTVGLSKGTTITPQQGGQQIEEGNQGSGPPQAALDACVYKSVNASCSFTGVRGETITGTCQTPAGSSLACVPR